MRDRWRERPSGCARVWLRRHTQARRRRADSQIPAVTRSITAPAGRRDCLKGIAAFRRRCCRWGKATDSAAAGVNPGRLARETAALRGGLDAGSQVAEGTVWVSPGRLVASSFAVAVQSVAALDLG
jgi:hypothetical protein